MKCRNCSKDYFKANLGAYGQDICPYCYEDLTDWEQPVDPGSNEDLADIIYNISPTDSPLKMLVDQAKRDFEKVFESNEDDTL